MRRKSSLRGRVFLRRPLLLPSRGGLRLCHVQVYARFHAFANIFRFHVERRGLFTVFFLGQLDGSFAHVYNGTLFFIIPFSVVRRFLWIERSMRQVQQGWLWKLMDGWIQTHCLR